MIALEKHGDMLPEATLDSIKQEQDRAQGSDHHSDRRRLPQRQCRPAAGARALRQSAPGQDDQGRAGAVFDDIDLVIVRENMEDMYAGIEFDTGTPEAAEVIDAINARSKKQVDPSAAISIKMITPEGIAPDREVRLRVRPRQRPQEGHDRPQSEHHEVHRRSLPAGRAGSRRGLSRYRVQRPHRRQHVHAADAEAANLRRAGDAESVRRHRQRSGRRA